MSSQTLFLDEKLYHYWQQILPAEAEILTALRKLTHEMPNGHMQICPEQGQLMQWLIKLIGAKNTLEIGVFTGYSSLAVALALPEDGRMVACDVNKEWTDIAQQFWKKAGVAHKINLHLAPALETLNTLSKNSFDFAFIDADKANQENYYEKALSLIRSGGVIAIDNIFFHGEVCATEKSSAVKIIDTLNRKLATDPRVQLMVLPIGDGLTLLRRQ